MSELKPCPFCGSEVQDDERGEKYPKKSPMGGWIIHCECCGASLSQFRKSGKDEISWNTRPIEDVLNKRIAELEKDNDEFRQLIHDWIIILTPDDGYVPDSECNDVATPIDVALRKRIAELEGKIDQLTAHDATERQDDKSPNDTQPSTIVCGKESEE